MTPELINLYIERLLQEIDILNKNKFMIEVQLKYTELLNIELQKKIKELEEKIEKNNKRQNKKEVNTSSDVF